MIYNPVRIFFASEAQKALRKLTFDKNILLITTQGWLKRGLNDFIDQNFDSKKITIYSQVQSNPQVKDLVDAYGKLKVQIQAPELIIALGGGSVLDFSKGLKACFERNDPPKNWLENHLIDGVKLSGSDRKLDFFVIPTTSGTGSEVTQWGTLWDFDLERKYSISDESLYPTSVFLFPELTVTQSKSLTVSSGLDALSHCLESLWNVNSNPYTDVLAFAALEKIPKCLVELNKNPTSANMREEMQIAALFAGLAMSQTKTAIAHSISYPITAKYQIPHGIACSFTLPEVLRFNWDKLQSKQAKINNFLNVSSSQNASDKISHLLRELGVYERLKESLPKDFYIEPDLLINVARANLNITAVDKENAAMILNKSLKNID